MSSKLQLYSALLYLSLVGRYCVSIKGGAVESHSSILFAAIYSHPCISMRLLSCSYAFSPVMQVVNHGFSPLVTAMCTVFDQVHKRDVCVACPFDILSQRDVFTHNTEELLVSLYTRSWLHTEVFTIKLP